MMGDQHKMEFTVAMKLPEEKVHIGLARRVCREVLGSFGVGSQDVDDIETVVGELATNAVCHAHDENYTIEIKVASDLAVVTVSDHGIGFSREMIAPPGTLRTGQTGQMERIGGWGIPIVVSLTDRVDFYESKPHGTTVRVEKQLNKEAA